MLSMMIYGPRQFGNDTDVYLSPLVKNLKLLWVDRLKYLMLLLLKLSSVMQCYFAPLMTSQLTL